VGELSFRTVLMHTHMTDTLLTIHPELHSTFLNEILLELVMIR